MRTRFLAALTGLASLAACATRADEFDHPYVSKQLQERTGLGLGDADLPPQLAGPPRPLTEDESVAVALWRNSAFQEALAELGFRRADIIQAGQLPNPVLSVLFPLGPKQLEFTAKMPLEVFWLRPSRVAVAELDAERAASLLVQGGLDLIRDVRSAFADWGLAVAREALATEALAARSAIASLTEARLAAGDASEAEVSTARADAARARADAAARRAEREAALERLRSYLGPERDGTEFTFRETPAKPAPPLNREALLKEALAWRPDLRAAEFAIESAGERAGLARWEFLQISGILDANGKGTKGFEAGPGVELPIPIFNQNQGGRSRADAEVVRAARHYTVVRDRIALDVREAEIGLRAAIEAAAAAASVTSLLEEALRQSESAQRNGDTSLLPVQDAKIRLLDARLRSAEAATEGRRARARLDRAVGRRLE